MASYLRAFVTLIIGKYLIRYLEEGRAKITAWESIAQLVDWSLGYDLKVFRNSCDFFLCFFFFPFFISFLLWAGNIHCQLGAHKLPTVQDVISFQLWLTPLKKKMFSEFSGPVAFRVPRKTNKQKYTKVVFHMPLSFIKKKFPSLHPNKRAISIKTAWNSLEQQHLEFSNEAFLWLHIC